ncbi:MAG: hypothetical protein ISP83_07115 [Candidatus Poseidonia sp.]|nr:hypothetical protein [Poseidonia sp.]
MPKAKPTHVIVHRIELQEKEREMLEPLIMARSVNELAMPVVAGAGVYAGYKVGKAAFGWAEDIYDGVRERVTKQKNSEFTEYKNIFGLPGWGLIPGIL